MRSIGETSGSNKYASGGSTMARNIKWDGRGM